MALCAVASPRPSLSQMLSDADALVTDFMDAYAAELPPELAQVCTTARDLFLKRHLRVRLGQLFRLTVKAAEAVLHEAGADEHDAAGWVQSFEDSAGFEFREHTVPESANLVTMTVAGAEAAKGPLKERSLPRVSVPTVGAELQDRAEEFRLSECCFSVITTLDPTTQKISEPEVEQFSDSVMECIGTQFGRYNLGRPFCRILGRQLETRLPKLPEGKGKDRAWWKILYNKTKNRKNVSCPHTCDRLTDWGCRSSPRATPPQHAG